VTQAAAGVDLRVQEQAETADHQVREVQPMQQPL